MDEKPGAGRYRLFRKLKIAWNIDAAYVPTLLEEIHLSQNGVGIFHFGKTPFSVAGILLNSCKNDRYIFRYKLIAKNKL
jgi:hypothetical protein